MLTYNRRILCSAFRYLCLIIQVPSGLPRNLEAAIEHYGSASFKATAATVLDAGGKTLVSLTYAKLLSRANKIAYNLLNKVGTKGTSELKTGDRVGACRSIANIKIVQ
jgi:hypothetical protein